MVGSVFFNTLLEISSGPGALSGANRLIVSRICRIVTRGSYRDLLDIWLKEYPKDLLGVVWGRRSFEG